MREIILGLIFTLLLFLGANLSANEREVKKDILIISSFSPSTENSSYTLPAFTERICAKGNVRPIVQYLNSESGMYPEWKCRMRSLLKDSKIRPELVVILGNEAWAAYRECARAWAHIPVILGDVTYFTIDYENNGENEIVPQERLIRTKDTFGGYKVYGYYQKDNMRATIQLIKQIMPHVRHLALCNDDIYQIPYLRELADDVCREYGIDFVYLSGKELTTSQLLDTIARMDDTYALVIYTWYLDKDRNVPVSNLLHKGFARYTDKAFFQTKSKGVQTMNFIGGVYATGQGIGRELALLAESVLQGDDQVVHTFSASGALVIPRVNYPVFCRLGLDEDNLPDNVYLNNKEQTFWEQYKYQTIIVALLFLFLLIVTLMAQWSRYKYHRQNKRQHALLESMSCMVAIFDRDLVLKELINPQSNVLICFREDEIVGKSIHEFGQFHEEYKAGMESLALYLERAFVTKEVQDFNFQIVYKGNTYYTDIKVVPFSLTKVFCYAQDMTQFVSQRQKLAESQMRMRLAEESSQMKSAFLANMSHEIRTPLNAIVGFSQLILETDDPEEKKNFAGIIETNNELLLQLVNDVLDLSKIEANHYQFVFSMVDLPQLCEDLCQTHRLRVQLGVTLSCQASPDITRLYTDKNRLSQVLSNFLSNAIKYTSYGTITLGYAKEGGFVRFYVRDTGKGLKKEDLPYVFDRFTKFDPFVQGTGLGLSICKTLIEKLGGEIGVESEWGEGSTFWFKIPLEKNKEKEI
ncbi:MAG: ATP-binding protein [Parabacteroides sp.]|nr:ATP-binding protein [Parabacteroides sp.]